MAHFDAIDFLQEGFTNQEKFGPAGEQKSGGDATQQQSCFREKCQQDNVSGAGVTSDPADRRQGGKVRGCPVGSFTGWHGCCTFPARV